MSLALLLHTRMPRPDESAEEREVRLAVAGDGSAFDRLLLRYDRDLRAYLGRRIAGDDVEDVMQEVRLAAWNGLSQFDRRSRFKTWLYGVAINKYRDFCRKRARLRHEMPIEHVERGLAMPDLFDRSDTAHMAASAIECLSEAQREVVELYYAGSFTLPEIANMLGRNLNTVKYQFYRAHAQIADALGGSNAARL